MASVTDRQNGSRAPFWSPYVAGFGLGLTLLGSYIVLGTGLGASGGIARCAAWLQHQAAPAHTEQSAYFGGWFGAGASPVLAYYLVAMVAGVLLGAFLSAWGSGRVHAEIERGPTMPRLGRLALALLGGVLVGFSSRLARGCTSGQALSGTAMLFTGSLVFLVCLFAGGYAAAWIVRRQWR
jgi:uncharacterized membrane protein YedE/YeeE